MVPQCQQFVLKNFIYNIFRSINDMIYRDQNLQIIGISTPQKDRIYMFQNL